MSAVQKKRHGSRPFVPLSHTQFFLLPFLHPSLSPPLSSAAIEPLGTSGPPLKRVLAQEDRPVSLVMALCFRGDRCVRSERAAVFVRKCLDGVQSPNEAQVLMAARGTFIETVFVRELSVCQ